MKTIINFLVATSLTITSWTAQADIFTSTTDNQTFLKIEFVPRGQEKWVSFQQCSVANPQDCLQVGNRAYAPKELEVLKQRLSSATSGEYFTVLKDFFLILIPTAMGVVFGVAAGAEGGIPGMVIGGVVVGGASFWSFAKMASRDERRDYQKRINELSVQGLDNENFAANRLEITTSIEHFIAVLDYQLSTLD